MDATLTGDDMVTLKGVDGVFRKVETVVPSIQRFNDDGWNQSVILVSCPRCRTLIPPFTRWDFCPGCGVEFMWEGK